MSGTRKVRGLWCWHDWRRVMTQVPVIERCGRCGKERAQEATDGD